MHMCTEYEVSMSYYVAREVLMYWSPIKTRRSKVQTKLHLFQMAGVLYKDEGHAEVTPSIGIDYQLYTMATPVRYIIKCIQLPRLD